MKRYKVKSNTPLIASKITITHDNYDYNILVYMGADGLIRGVSETMVLNKDLEAKIWKEGQKAFKKFYSIK